MGIVLCWFHQDLRLGENPVLDEAIKSGHAVLPVYILDDEAAGDWAPGGASRWWLHHSLNDLSREIERLGSRLILRIGDAGQIIPQIAQEVEARAIFTQIRAEPWASRQVQSISDDLAQAGCTIHQINAAYLTCPGDVLSKSGGRMKIFTPYKRNLLAVIKDGVRPLCPRPEHLPTPPKWPSSETLESFNLLPKSPDWSGGLKASWQVGEAAALQRLDDFIHHSLGAYHLGRDNPSVLGTSRLSPHLHFGEISPLTIYHRVLEKLTLSDGADGGGAEKFISEIIWREFACELLDQFPDMPERALRPEFEKFPWADDFDNNLNAWQEGRTGYPLIDAGMRELYATGWMHNRVRMISASFLTKHLLIPWQLGAKWFFDTLVDADLANNSAGWQWVAGCGVDASPYFRIFNPITQGAKFDAYGYVRKWCPELEGLDDQFLFKPFDLPEMMLVDAGITLGENYPQPLVHHPTARMRALEAFHAIRL